MQGLILYGPPASGKSTITTLLEESGGFALFPRLKAGQGNTTGYRMTPLEALGRLRDSGDLLWENERYGATYAVDRSHLDRMLSEVTLPVVHLGQPEGVEAILAAYPEDTWLVVELRADLIDTEARIHLRGDEDAASRLEAWAATPKLGSADLYLDTSCMSPMEAVTAIRKALIRAASS